MIYYYIMQYLLGLCISSLLFVAVPFSIRNTVLTLYKKTGQKQIENLEPLLEEKPNSKLIISTPGGLFQHISKKIMI